MSKAAVETGTETKIETKIEKSSRQAVRRPMGRKVLCIETGKIYDSIRDAAGNAGVSVAIMRACLPGKRMGAMGYHWQYAEEEDLLEAGVAAKTGEIEDRKADETIAAGSVEKTVKSTAKTMGKDEKATDLEKKAGPRKVLCIETGDLYASVTAAAKAAGVQRTTVSMCLTGKRKTAGGTHWIYADSMEAARVGKRKKTVKGAERSKEEPKTKMEEETGNNTMDSSVRKARGRKGRRVLCVDSGEIYSSVSEAAKILGIGNASIRSNLAGKSKTAGGYRWAYAEDQLSEEMPDLPADSANVEEEAYQKSAGAQPEKAAEKPAVMQVGAAAEEAEIVDAPDEDTSDLTTSSAIEARIASNNEALRELRARCDMLNAENEELAHRLEKINDETRIRELFEQALASGMSTNEIKKRLGL